MIRTWTNGRFVGWYINLEQSWRRTSIGFDSRDDILDVVADPELTTTTLKDEDELDFAVQAGYVTPQEAMSIRAAAEGVRRDIAGKFWPFTESAWQALAIPNGLPPVALPPRWDVP